jgi:hypothetical protein
VSGHSHPPSQAQEWQPAYGDRWEDWEEQEYDEDRRPRGRVGLISPLRVLLFLVVLVAAGIAFYGLFMEQSAMQLPLSITGLGLLALSTLLLSLSLARAAAQLGRRGSGGRALLAALLGGMFIIGAAGAGAGAIILTLLTAL